jgi:hypothetical protein
MNAKKGPKSRKASIVSRPIRIMKGRHKFRDWALIVNGFCNISLPLNGQQALRSITLTPAATIDRFFDRDAPSKDVAKDKLRNFPISSKPNALVTQSIALA